MSSLLPTFLNLTDTQVYEDYLLRSEVLEIPPSETPNTGGGLNSNSQIIFTYSGQQIFYRLCSPRTGFRCRVGYLTRAGGADAMNADTTLANNFFPHLFSCCVFKLGGVDIERVNYPGVASDILLNTKGEEFRYRGGEMLGFIPDTGAGVADTKPTLNPDVAANAAVVANFSTINPNYNEGYAKRKKLYNYTVAADATIRYYEIFYPLSALFSFCEEFDKVLKFIGFRVELTRKARDAMNNCIFGATNTNIRFGDNNNDNTGLLSLTLELEYVTPVTDLSVKLDKQLSKPLETAFLIREVKNRLDNNNSLVELNWTSNNIPRYVFVVCHATTGNANQEGATQNYQLFRHCQIRHVTVLLDGVPYPPIQYTNEFQSNTFIRSYRDFQNVCRCMESECAISVSEYRTLYPVFAIDLRAQKEKLNNTPINVNVRIERDVTNTNNDAGSLNPINVEYFILVLNQKKIKIDATKNIVTEIV